MKTYKIVSKEPIPGRAIGGWKCDGCIFSFYDNYEGHDSCIEPDELECYNNIWVLEEIDDPNVPEVKEE